MTDWTKDLTAELPLGAIPFGDRTLITGGAISDNGDGTATVATCTAWCKITDSDTAVGKFFTFVGDTSVSLTDMTTNFIYLDYNGGAPQIVVGTAILTYGLKQDHIHIGTIFRNDTTLHYHLANNIGISGISKADIHHREETAAHRASGLVTSDGGSLALSVTDGVIYEGLSRQATSVNGGAATWSTWYRTNSSWTEVTGQSTVDNAQYNDTSSGLVNFTSNRYGTFFVYVDIDGAHLHLVYGTGNVVINLAEEAGVPATLPNQVVNYGVLIAKIIVQQGQTTLTITYPWTIVFTSSFATDHNSLANLTVGDVHTQYVKHALATAANDFLVASGSGTYVKKTLAETLAILAHTHALAAGATDVTATAAEVNLLDLAALTTGELLVVTAATTAAWQSTGVVLTSPKISGTVTTDGLTMPEVTFNAFPITPSSAPDANYEVANKKYVDDNAGGLPTATQPVNSKGNSFASLQDCIDDLAGDGWVYAPAGTYSGAFTIANANVLLFGAGDRSTILDGGTTGHALAISATGCTVRDLQVKTTLGQGNSYSGIYSTAGIVILNKVYVSQSDHRGVYISGANNRIISCYIYTCDGVGIEMSSTGDNTVIVGNLIRTTGDDGILIDAAAEDCVVTSNRISNWTNEAIDDNSGTSTVGHNDTTV